MKKYFRVFAFSVLAFQAAVSWAASDHISAEAHVDKKSVYVGDRIAYVLNVYAGRDLGIEMPMADDGTMAPFVIKDFRPTVPSINRSGVSYETTYIIATYTTGKLSIPSPVVKYRLSAVEEWKTVTAPAIQIEVKSLLGGKGARELRDIKDILSAGIRLLVPILAGALVLAFIIASAVLFYRIIKKKTASPPRPAHVVAYEELDRIKMSGLVADKKIREYYFRLSACIRRYIESRFAVRAPEMTSEEFLLAIRDSELLEARHKQWLREFLANADMVKFARYGPTHNEVETALDLARKFVDETKEAETPSPPPAA